MARKITIEQFEKLKLEVEKDKALLQEVSDKLVKKCNAVCILSTEYIRQQKEEIDLEYIRLQREEIELECIRLQKEVTEQREQSLAIEREVFRKEKERFENARDRSFSVALNRFPLSIKLIVGGTEFETTANTLLSPAMYSPDENSVLAVTLLEMLRADPQSRQIKIDRSPEFFDKVLDYLRQRSVGVGKPTTGWLEGWLHKCSQEDLILIRHEAEFYKIRSLANYITWELVSRLPSRAVRSVTEVGFKALQNNLNAIVGYTTVTPHLHIQGKNFKNFEFKNVEFRGTVTFSGCLLKGARFIQCTFAGNVIFSDCDVSGIQFHRCNGQTLTPSEVFHLSGSIGQLPDTFT